MIRLIVIVGIGLTLLWYAAVAAIIAGAVLLVLKLA